MIWADFFHMGGYALYVWPSYGLALAVLVANLILPLRRQRQILQGLRRAQRQQARKQAGRAAAEENAA